MIVELKAFSSIPFTIRRLPMVDFIFLAFLIFFLWFGIFVVCLLCTWVAPSPFLMNLNYLYRKKDYLSYIHWASRIMMLHTARSMWILSWSIASVMEYWSPNLFIFIILWFFIFLLCMHHISFANMVMWTRVWFSFVVIDGKIGSEWGWWESKHRNYLLECYGYSFRWW